MGPSGEQPPEPLRSPQVAGESVRLEAHASGQARIHQAARDLHYQDGVRGTRRVEPGTQVGECPYPGLASFGREQARWFFGRDQLTAKLIARLDDRLRTGGVQVVVAPSGAGKSSLLHAGLLPQLACGALPGSSQWPMIVFTPTADPLTALATHIATLTDADPAALPEKLAADLPSAGRVLSQALRRCLGAENPQARVVVIVDQFEELFTLCPDDQHRHAALSTPLTGHTNRVAAVAFSPEGRTLSTASYDHTVRLWNVTDPAHPIPLGPPLTGHTDTVHAVAFNHDGRTLATGSTDKTVQLWDVTNPAHPTALGPPLTGHTNVVNAVAFSPDEHTLASGSGDQTVRLWNVIDPAHPTALGPPLTGHTNVVNAVAFSSNGRTLATGSNDQTVHLWDIPRTFLTNHTDYVNAVVFSPDGRIMASGSADRTVRLWNVTDPAHPTPLGQPLTGHTNSVRAVVFRPDGHILASGSDDHTVRLWKVIDPVHPTPLGPPLTGHTSYVNNVVFSPDGHTLASGGYDGTVRLWNVADPTHPTPLGQPLTGHTHSVVRVAFSPDGHTLATGSEDDTIRLWEMNVDRVIQRICAITRKTLTPALWKQYVSPDLPYRPPCP